MAKLPNFQLKNYKDSHFLRGKGLLFKKTQQLKEKTQGFGKF